VIAPHPVRLQSAHRLDLSVNILTNHAVNKGKITVFGGDQMRPTCISRNMVDAYVMMLEAPAEKIQGEVFNIAFQNHSIADIAKIVKKVVEQEMPELGDIEIVTTPATTTAPITSIPTRCAACWALRPSAIWKTRCAIWPAPSRIT